MCTNKRIRYGVNQRETVNVIPARKQVEVPMDFRVDMKHIIPLLRAKPSNPLPGKPDEGKSGKVYSPDSMQ